MSITDHKFSDPNIYYAEQFDPEEDAITLGLNFTSGINLNRTDIIALARHAKVTAEDLEGKPIPLLREKPND